MRAVLYTFDLQPITVIDLEPWAWAHLEKRGRVSLAVFPSLSYTPAHANLGPATYMSVHIKAELFRRGEQRSLMLFTDDEVAALLLPSELLPGQIKDDRERQRRAFAEGFLYALNKLGH